MDDLAAFGWMALGVLLAVVLPILRAYVQRNFKADIGVASSRVRPLAALAAFALVTAILLLAAYRAAEPNADIDWFTALLAGFGWESTFEKLSGTHL